MNKWFKIIGFVIFVSFIGNTSAHAASSTSLFVNGKVEFDFITVEGRTMVKLRSLSDPSWPVLAIILRLVSSRFKIKIRVRKDSLWREKRQQQLMGKQ